MNLAEILLPARPPVVRGKVRIVVFDEVRRRYLRRRQKAAAAHAIWYAKNAEAQKAKRRARYLAAKEKELEQNRAWRARNPERKKLISKLWARKRRAKLKALGLTSRGRPIGAKNPSHFKKGWRNAARP
jgi:hypothetical protein